MEGHRLRPKYMVTRMDDSGIMSGPSMPSTDPEDINSPFVLMPRKDPAAFEAMRAYMSLCEPQLANEIRAWLRKIAAAEPVYGTQGKRNRAFIRSRMLQEVE